MILQIFLDREAPKLEVIETHTDADIVEFHNGIESLLKSINNDFQDNNVFNVFENYKDSLIESLTTQKNNIEQLYKVKNGKKSKKILKIPLLKKQKF